MNVFPVPPLSKLNLEASAQRVLQEFQPEVLEAKAALNVTTLVDSFLTQKTGWSLDVRTDGLLPGDIEGVVDPKTKTVVVTEATYEKLYEDDGRARFTLSHEFSHVHLHAATMKIRMVTMTPSSERLYRTERTSLKPYRDPEWQADYHAGALLMPLPAVVSLMKKHSSATLERALQDIFKVSASAAHTRLTHVRGLLEKHGGRIPMF